MLTLSAHNDHTIHSASWFLFFSFSLLSIILFLLGFFFSGLHFMQLIAVKFKHKSEKSSKVNACLPVE